MALVKIEVPIPTRLVVDNPNITDVVWMTISRVNFGTHSPITGNVVNPIGEEARTKGVQFKPMSVLGA
jgi:hypothetical protein